MLSNVSLLDPSPRPVFLCMPSSPGKTPGSSGGRLFVVPQPAKKEYINKGWNERKNPGEHLREPCGIKTVHVARLGESAGTGSGNAARELDLQGGLGMGAPQPVRHRGRENDQQEGKQGYSPLLWRHRLHFLLSQGFVVRRESAG